MAVGLEFSKKTKKTRIIVVPPDLQQTNISLWFREGI